mmetsp:Transcript_37897/g.109260  ORF Transcript_37897/g.109260 Transcript_37897/m.109260 type:complete len:112 (-) Transcript_37897:91-426(-)
MHETPMLVMDNAPSHTAAKSRVFYDKVSKDLPAQFLFQPASSPDLSPLDFFVWDRLKSKIEDCNSVEVLKVRITQAWNEMRAEWPEMGPQIQKEFVKRLTLCIAAGGGHFE